MRGVRHPPPPPAKNLASPQQMRLRKRSATLRRRRKVKRRGLLAVAHPWAEKISAHPAPSLYETRTALSLSRGTCGKKQARGKKAARYAANGALFLPTAPARRRNCAVVRVCFFCSACLGVLAVFCCVVGLVLRSFGGGFRRVSFRFASRSAAARWLRRFRAAVWWWRSRRFRASGSVPSGLLFSVPRGSLRWLALRCRGLVVSCGSPALRSSWSSRRFLLSSPASGVPSFLAG